jgi:hypothetical protein
MIGIKIFLIVQLFLNAWFLYHIFKLQRNHVRLAQAFSTNLDSQIKGQESLGSLIDILKNYNQRLLMLEKKNSPDNLFNIYNNEKI